LLIGRMLGYAVSVMKGYAVSNQLQRPGVRLLAAARFGEGLAAALWERTDRGHYRYEAPDHHTLCFGAIGGEAYRRRRGRSVQPSFGEGQSVILPAGMTSDWEADGNASVFHLYIPTALFERRVVETLNAAPGSVILRDEGFKRDQTLEGIIRSTVLPLSWNEPADRIAMSEAGELLTTYLAASCSELAPRALLVRGGLGRQLRCGECATILSLNWSRVSRSAILQLWPVSVPSILPTPSNAPPAVARISTCCGGASTAPSALSRRQRRHCPRWRRPAALEATAIFRHVSARQPG
jgi:hypothetical protein